MEDSNMLWIALFASSVAAAAQPPASACTQDVDVPVVTRATYAHVPRVGTNVRGMTSVELNLVVGIDGRAHEASATDPSLSGSLKRAAIRAVDEWQFTPAQACGQTVAQAMTVTVPVIESTELTLVPGVPQAYTGREENHRSITKSPIDSF
jgi:TonB family protein